MVIGVRTCSYLCSFVHMNVATLHMLYLFMYIMHLFVFVQYHRNKDTNCFSLYRDYLGNIVRSSTKRLRLCAYGDLPCRLSEKMVCLWSCRVRYPWRDFPFPPSSCTHGGISCASVGLYVCGVYVKYLCVCVVFVFESTKVAWAVLYYTHIVISWSWWVMRSCSIYVCACGCLLLHAHTCGCAY